MRLSFLAVGLAIAFVTACQQQEGPDESVTEQESISTPTSTVTFPSTQVGNTSGPITIQINPVGQTSNTITSISYSCPDYSVQATLPGYAYKFCETTCLQEQCPVAAAPALICETEPYYFTATFHPTVAVTSSCQLAVVANTGTIYIQLTGTGTPPPISADVVPTALNFGDVRRNTTSSVGTATIRNTGGQVVSVSNITTSGAFALAGGTTTAFSLSPGETRGIGVTCTPSAVGPTSGTLSIANSYSPLSVSLACNGIDSNLDISPSPMTLPTTRVGEPRTQNITLTNSGGASMMLTSVSLTGSGMTLTAAPPANTMLSPGQSTSATVSFAADASGDAAGTLTVMYDGGQARTSQITARAVNTSMSMSPNGSVDLGPVCMGQSASKQFQIVANEQGPFRVDSISMPSGAFTVDATGLPASIQGAGGNTYQFTVSASPTETGLQSATLTVSTDIPGASPQETMVVVEGLAGGVNGSPAELDLGGVPVGANTVGQSVKITNCDLDTVTLSNARIEGLDAGEFTIVDFPDSLDVASTDTVEFLVIASPNSVGTKMAEFKVDHAGGTITVPLLGDGLGEQPGEEEDDAGRPSYYACSVGGSASAAAAWPLALAFAFAVRRRRRR